MARVSSSTARASQERERGRRRASERAKERERYRAVARGEGVQDKAWRTGPAKVSTKARPVRLARWARFGLDRRRVIPAVHLRSARGRGLSDRERG